MTEKRFTIKNSNIVQDGYFINDNVGNFSFPTTTDGSDLLMYEKSLNKLAEENEQLKKDVEFFKGYREDLEEVVVEKEVMKSEINNLLKSINGTNCLRNKKCFKIFNRIKEMIE